MFKVFLEGQVCGAVVTAGSDQTGNRFDDGSGCAEERVLLHVVRIKTEAHDGCGRALSVLCRQGSCHDLRRSQLILAAVPA